jgi:hypothetical protein
MRHPKPMVVQVHQATHPVEAEVVELYQAIPQEEEAVVKLMEPPLTAIPRVVAVAGE